MTATRKEAAKQRRELLLMSLVEATTGEYLRHVLDEYERTGDHDHGRGPIKPGGGCNGYLGDDCWVKRARIVLAAIEKIDSDSTRPVDDGQLAHLVPALAFYRGPHMADDDQAALRDMLTDMRHLAKKLGLDFDTASDGAREVFNEEAEEAT